MNKDYVQNLRYKLQKRVKRLNSIEFQAFHSSLKQFWGFLRVYPIFMDILEYLERNYPSMESESTKIFDNSEELFVDDEFKNAALSYFVIKKCVESDHDKIEMHIGGIYSHARGFEESIDSFRSFFLEPLYEYLDEQLDDQRAILALLRRYKHKCEWFQREKLLDLWKSGGEKELAFHLYEYLHDQGLDFVIEPSSASGEADLVAAQASDDPLIADTKIFNPSRGQGKTYIAKGFNQIYLYTLDYNKPFGYLVIYKTCERDLNFSFPSQEQSIPFIVHNNKTIFILTIDIYPHVTSASQRGVLRPITITEDDLIKSIETDSDMGIK